MNQVDRGEELGVGLARRCDQVGDPHRVEHRRSIVEQCGDTTGQRADVEGLDTGDRVGEQCFEVGDHIGRDQRRDGLRHRLEPVAHRRGHLRRDLDLGRHFAERVADGGVEVDRLERRDDLLDTLAERIGYRRGRQQRANVLAQRFERGGDLVRGVDDPGVLDDEGDLVDHHPEVLQAVDGPFEHLLRLGRNRIDRRGDRGERSRSGRSRR